MGELADTEPLVGLPEVPYPAVWEATPIVAANALVAVDGNNNSVPPALVGTEVTVRRRLGDDELVVISPTGTVVAAHRVAPRGTGRVISIMSLSGSVLWRWVSTTVVSATVRSDRLVPVLAETAGYPTVCDPAWPWAFARVY